MMFAGASKLNAKATPRSAAQLSPHLSCRAPIGVAAVFFVNALQVHWSLVDYMGDLKKVMSFDV